MEAERTFEISPDVLCQEVSGETVLLDLESEAYFGLDEVGTRIWQMLSGGATVAATIDSLLEEYAVDRATLEQDVGELITRLLEAGLIKP